jgi:ubiquinone biosynthesis protein UbiJ
MPKPGAALACALFFIPLACRTGQPAPSLPAASSLRGARLHVTTWPAEFAIPPAARGSEDRQDLARIFREAFTNDLAAGGVAVVESDGDLDLNFDFLGLDGSTYRASATLIQPGTGEVQALKVDDSVECYDSWEDKRSGNLERCFARHLAIDLLQSPQATLAFRSNRSPEHRSPEHRSAEQQRRALSGKLAVLELRNFAKDLTRENVQYFTDVVRGAALRAQPQLEVITRENLMVLMQASGKDLANCEGECEVDTGRRIGADEIITGEIQRLGTLYKLTLRLHDTREGRLLGSTQASGKSIEELDASAQKSAEELLR